MSLGCSNMRYNPFISPEYLADMHKISIADAKLLCDYSLSQTIRYKECYGNGEIMFPKWQKLMNESEDLLKPENLRSPFNNPPPIKRAKASPLKESWLQRNLFIVINIPIFKFHASLMYYTAWPDEKYGTQFWSLEIIQGTPMKCFYFKRKLDFWNPIDFHGWIIEKKADGSTVTYHESNR